jgi:transcriptional regulator with XRE-family HTH domain
MKTATQIKLGNQIKRNRLAHQFPQGQLADLIHATQREVAAWEKGEQMPSERQLRRLAHVIGITIEV